MGAPEEASPRTGCSHSMPPPLSVHVVYATASPVALHTGALARAAAGDRATGSPPLTRRIHTLPTASNSTRSPLGDREGHRTALAWNRVGATACFWRTGRTSGRSTRASKGMSVTVPSMAMRWMPPPKAMTTPDPSACQSQVGLVPNSDHVSCWSRSRRSKSTRSRPDARSRSTSSVR